MTELSLFQIYLKIKELNFSNRKVKARNILKKLPKNDLYKMLSEANVFELSIQPPPQIFNNWRMHFEEIYQLSESIIPDFSHQAVFDLSCSSRRDYKNYLESFKFLLKKGVSVNIENILDHIESIGYRKEVNDLLVSQLKSVSEQDISIVIDAYLNNLKSFNKIGSQIFDEFQPLILKLLKMTSLEKNGPLFTLVLDKFYDNDFKALVIEEFTRSGSIIPKFTETEKIDLSRIGFYRDEYLLGFRNPEKLSRIEKYSRLIVIKRHNGFELFFQEKDDHEETEGPIEPLGILNSLEEIVSIIKKKQDFSFNPKKYELAKKMRKSF